MAPEVTRRGFLKESALVTAGAALAASAGGTAGAGEAPPPKPLAPGSKNTLATGKIGNLEISRMLLGGNLLTHFTHSRDLRYVYNLAAHYNTPEKILETLAVAEEHGINTLNIHWVPEKLALLREHRKRGGKMKWIICPTALCDDKMADYTHQAKQLVEWGADALYLWGVRADQLTNEKKADLIGKAVDVAKAQGVPSGVGAHELAVVKLCEENKIPLDFYVKTLHSHDYPSAKLNFDSMWCKNPEETVQVMSAVEKPWIAFKVMAAGAIPPKKAYRYAFESGADFCLSGMFDYEIAEDVRTMKEILADVPNRKRPWRA
jgi:hypothetical protein